MTVTEIVKAVGLPVKVLAGIALAAGCLLVAPDSVLSGLKLNDLMLDYGGYVGGAFILSLGVTVTSLGAQLFTALQPAFSEYRNNKKKEKYLQDLSDYEKHILKNYIEHNAKTQDIDGFNGDIVSLKKHDILYRARGAGLYESAQYNIDLHVKAYLEKNQHLLD